MAVHQDGVQDWVLRWFEGHGPIPGETLEARLRADYFEAGLIDSLSVVQLVADVEQEYSVRFSDAHYRDPRFSTIGGLAAIVEELRAKKA